MFSAARHEALVMHGVVEPAVCHIFPGIRRDQKHNLEFGYRQIGVDIVPQCAIHVDVHPRVRIVFRIGADQMPRTLREDVAIGSPSLQFAAKATVKIPLSTRVTPERRFDPVSKSFTNFATDP